MYTPQEIIDLVKTLTSTTDAMISDTEMLGYLNIEYKKIYYKIVDLDKNYFWNRWNADLIANQNEYSLLDPVNYSAVPLTPATF
jgi:hypothetical protein